MLFDDLKKAKMEAMKAHDQNKRSAYEAVISKCMLLIVEAKAQGKEFSDNDTLSVIQKVIKELEEEKLGFEKAGREETVESLKKQIEALNLYLPKQLTDDEIKEIISNLPDKTMPNIMKHFKTNYQGKCDMRKVSEIAKNL